MLLILARFVSRLVGDLVTQLLRGVGFDGLPARLGLAPFQAPGARTPAEMTGMVVRTLVMSLCHRRDLRRCSGSTASPGSRTAWWPS